MCGRVVGYHWGAPDAVSTQFSGHYDINSHYVDGVSITHGYPRQHVWTLMAGINQAGPTSWPGDARYNCPCSPGSPQNSTLQSFIGNDYFCESGNHEWMGRMNSIFSTHLIHCGTVKVVALLKVIVVQLMVSHGFTRFLKIPLLTALS